MTTPRTLQALVFVLALGVHQTDLSLGAAPPAPAVQATAGAARLLARAEQALADLLSAARQLPDDAGPDSVRAAPFWTALHRMSDALGAARTALAAKDPHFFRAIANGSHALAELGAAWPHLGVAAPAVDARLVSLAAPVSALRDRFGYEELRRRQGGPLTAAERQQLQRMQDQRRRLALALETLRQKASAEGNRELTAELDGLIAESNAIANAALTLETYLYALRQNDRLQGSWDGETPYVDARHQDEWLAADEVVDEMSVEGDAGFVFTADLGTVGPFLDGEGETAAPATEAAGTAGGGKVELLQERTPPGDDLAAAAGVADDGEDDGTMADLGDLGDLGMTAAGDERWSAAGGFEDEDLAAAPAAKPPAAAPHRTPLALALGDRKRGFHLFAGTRHDRVFHLFSGSATALSLAARLSTSPTVAVRVVRSASTAKPKGSAKRQAER